MDNSQFYLVRRKLRLSELLDRAYQLQGEYDNLKLLTVDPRERLRIDDSKADIATLVAAFEIEFEQLEEEIEQLAENTKLFQLDAGNTHWEEIQIALVERLEQTYVLLGKFDEKRLITDDIFTQLKLDKYRSSLCKEIEEYKAKLRDLYFQIESLLKKPDQN
jgi:hypothetical protein